MARATPPAPDRPNTEIYWNLGLAIDLLHMPLVLGLVILGASKWNGPVYVGIVTAVVVLQVALLACPCMALSGWLKRKHVPDYEGHWSFTYWLYNRFGPAVGIGVFLFFLLLALGVRALFF